MKNKERSLWIIAIIIFVAATLAWAGTFTSYNDISDLADTDEFLIYDASEGSGDYLANITYASLYADLETTMDGIKSNIASKSGAYTIGTDDAAECYGGVVYVTSAAVITACDGLTDGMGFSVITIGAIAVSLDVQSDDLQILDGVTLDDGDKATNTSTTGDSIVCTYYDATGWYCMSGSPDGDNWTDDGA